MTRPDAASRNLGAEGLHFQVLVYRFRHLRQGVLRRTGAQQADVDILQGEVGDVMSRDACNEDAGGRRQLCLIGGYGLHVADGHVLEDANRLLHVLVLAEHVQTGTQAEQHRGTYLVHRDVGYLDIAEVGTVYREEFDSPVLGVVDVAVADFYVLKTAHRLGSHLNACLIALQLHVGHDDIVAAHLAGSGLEAQGIVSADDVAPADAHVLATVDIDAVVVCHAEAADGDLMDIHVAALEVV